MTSKTVRDIKKAQRESLLLRRITELFRQVSLDDTRLTALFVNRVDLSPDKGLCTIYFYTMEGKKQFTDLLAILKLYKPSLRKALAHTLESRYTPELVFKFDEQFEKTIKIEQLIDKIKADDLS